MYSAIWPLTTGIAFGNPGNAKNLTRQFSMLVLLLGLRCEGHPSRSQALNDLGTFLGKGFLQCGKPEDLEEAIDLLPSLQARFDLYKRAGDLGEIIKLLRTTLEHCPQGHSLRHTALSYLARSLRMRFNQCGEPEDLNKAIELHSTALELCTEGDSQRSFVLSDFAVTLCTRFNQEGRPDDFDKAIKFHRAALELWPAGWPNRFLALNNFTNSLLMRFNQYGRSDDLVEAIEFHRAALELCREGHPHRSLCLGNLHLLYSTDFCVTDNRRISMRLLSVIVMLFYREEKDLDEAVELLNTAWGLCLEGDPVRYALVWKLAISLKSRFELCGQAEDLVKAVNLHRVALNLCSEEHPERPKVLNDLATSLVTRYKQYGQREDLDEAVKLNRAALNFCPEGHSYYYSSLCSLAESLYAGIRKRWRAEDFEECMQLLEPAATHSFSGLMMRLATGSLWAELAREHDHDTTMTAYKTAIALLQNALIISPTLHAQHNFLSGNNAFIMLAVEAASYAIEKNKLELAVEILEQGRGLLWFQMRGFRSPLEQLAETNKEFSDRFRDVNRRLENLATSSATLTPGLNVQVQQPSFDEMLKSKRQLAKERDEIINEIRRLPGFENFLAATPFKVLRRAASEGPVIMVNQYEQFFNDSLETYCELLLTREQFTASSSEYEVKLVEAMKMLWDRVVFKVVNKLEELGINEGSRIWWCTTTVLSALPFHAAGPYQNKDGTSKYLLDKYISSYTPTLGALINARSSGNGGEPTVLVVRDASLPSAKGEIRNIKNCGISTKTLSVKASHDAVIKALRKITWVHFVCHGSVDSKPLNSSFKVSDRGLTLLDIIQGNIPNAEFAFLSACHTAEQPPSVTQDEVLHLAATMQFSGFRSVIGSMWELLDVDGPFFAKTIYEYMWDCDEGEVRYKRAAAGLRQAALELKTRPGIETERWVNLVHIGA
ncbi:uncharacterized protein FOMMEDRAFT_156360 [Fomitiporia mediterranea MF3/22]|uniref:uncharacterized protein n=1 Tax=Fomitiporia mediterranea (strain MF3/22) TaxID=694068 RepID=UPI000440990D|nr:uncharacterized protein FOMMEDRAFT_156360 [Fomitiporia mediterranea MF3/22]EJD03002.1 hypothetical protein FOMMEDRAFT_156360 [Fomitiporia mediterranea MF3/22]